MSSEGPATTREAILRLLLRQGGCNAGMLANLIGISVQAMRRHLRRLENDGLVNLSSKPEGPGRPSNLWRLTLKGEDFFKQGNASEEFALDLLDTIDANFSRENISEILHYQMLQKSINYRERIGKGSLNTRLKKLIELRKKEGYSSELNILKDGSSWYLNAFNCSISSIAEKYPIVCDQELELLRNVFPDCVIQRVQWRFDNDHSCGFKFNPMVNDG